LSRLPFYLEAKAGNYDRDEKKVEEKARKERLTSFTYCA